MSGPLSADTFWRLLPCTQQCFAVTHQVSSAFSDARGWLSYGLLLDQQQRPESINALQTALARFTEVSKDPQLPQKTADLVRDICQTLSPLFQISSSQVPAAVVSSTTTTSGGKFEGTRRKRTDSQMRKWAQRCNYFDSLKRKEGFNPKRIVQSLLAMGGTAGNTIVSHQISRTLKPYTNTIGRLKKRENGSAAAASTLPGESPKDDNVMSVISEWRRSTAPTVPAGGSPSHRRFPGMATKLANPSALETEKFCAYLSALWCVSTAIATATLLPTPNPDDMLVLLQRALEIPPELHADVIGRIMPLCKECMSPRRDKVTAKRFEEAFQTFPVSRERNSALSHLTRLFEMGMLTRTRKQTKEKTKKPRKHKPNQWGDDTSRAEHTQRMVLHFLLTAHSLIEFSIDHSLSPSAVWVLDELTWRYRIGPFDRHLALLSVLIEHFDHTKRFLLTVKETLVELAAAARELSTSGDPNDRIKLQAVCHWSEYLVKLLRLRITQYKQCFPNKEKAVDIGKVLDILGHLFDLDVVVAAGRAAGVVSTAATPPGRAGVPQWVAERLDEGVTIQYNFLKIVVEAKATKGGLASVADHAVDNRRASTDSGDNDDWFVERISPAKLSLICEVIMEELKNDRDIYAPAFALGLVKLVDTTGRSYVRLLSDDVQSLCAQRAAPSPELFELCLKLAKLQNLVAVDLGVRNVPPLPLSALFGPSLEHWLTGCAEKLRKWVAEACRLDTKEPLNDEVLCSSSAVDVLTAISEPCEFLDTITPIIASSVDAAGSEPYAIFGKGAARALEEYASFLLNELFTGLPEQTKTELFEQFASVRLPPPPVVFAAGGVRSAPAVTQTGHSKKASSEKDSTSSQLKGLAVLANNLETVRVQLDEIAATHTFLSTAVRGLREMLSDAVQMGVAALAARLEPALATSLSASAVRAAVHPEEDMADAADVTLELLDDRIGTFYNSLFPNLFEALLEKAWALVIKDVTDVLMNPAHWKSVRAINANFIANGEHATVVEDLAMLLQSYFMKGGLSKEAAQRGKGAFQGLVELFAMGTKDLIQLHQSVATQAPNRGGKTDISAERIAAVLGFRAEFDKEAAAFVKTAAKKK